MEKENYHHGMLREDLIAKGLQLINQNGVEGFSLRKVAALCGVSHTAPYKHFKNKEELLNAISECVTKDFTEYLLEIAEKNQDSKCMVELGRAYVTYMLRNREYFEFMFFGELRLNVSFEEGNFIYEEESPFAVFYKAATRSLENRIQDSKKRNIFILNMWSQVHGLAALIVNQIIQTEDEIESLVEEMLTITLGGE